MKIYNNSLGIIFKEILTKVSLYSLFRVDNWFCFGLIKFIVFEGNGPGKLSELRKRTLERVVRFGDNCEVRNV